MHENQKIDGRDLRDGGWYWVQQELLNVFVPLIGRDAAWLYQVLCNLIPETIEKPYMELSVRTMAKAGGYYKPETPNKLSVGAVHRHLETLIAIGMVEKEARGLGKPPVLKLGSLRKLAALGTAELKKRLDGVSSVPAGNSGGKEPDPVPPAEGAADDAQGRADGVDAPSDGANPKSQEEAAPASAGQQTVPGGNTSNGGKSPVEMSLAEFHVFQKQGGTVPKKGGSRSSEEGPFNKVLNLSSLKTPPLPPQGGRLPSLTANADGKSKNQKPPHDAKGLAAAVAKVQRECGLSGGRIGGVIEGSMLLEGGKTDELPNWNAIAERMIAAYKLFLAQQDSMAYKVMAPRFFAELWDDGRKWPWDEKKLEARKRL
jgi:hypothetical protein